MAQTWTYEKAQLTASSVNMQLFDRTYLKHLETFQSSDGLKRRSTYILASGDQNYPLTVRSELHFNPSARKGKGTTNASIRISGVAVLKDDTTSEIIDEGDYSGVLALTIPGVAGMLDNDQALAVVMNLCSLWFNGVTVEVPNNTIISNFAYGFTDLI